MSEKRVATHLGVFLSEIPGGPSAQRALSAVGPSRAAAAQSRELHDLSAAPVVQARSDGSSSSTASGDVRRIAQQGVRGAGQPLPHLSAVQASFGPAHRLDGVRAHVGGAAFEAGRSIGAQAYATGNQVAFTSAPDLFTAAHEAAHVVQQRQGVSLSGGVSHEGDPYEQHADAVAERVVQGKSAADLLGTAGPHSAPVEAVQQSQDTRPLRERAREHILANVLSRADGQRLATIFETMFGKPPEKILVVGSHAELEHTDGSDIDVLFVTDIAGLSKHQGRGFEFFRTANPGRVPDGVRGIGPGRDQAMIGGQIPKAGTVDPFFKADGTYRDTERTPAIQIWP